MLPAVPLGHIEAESGGPAADASKAVVMSTTPDESVVPPLPLRLLAQGTGAQGCLGVGRFGSDLEVSYRRECQSCLDPAAAG